MIADETDPALLLTSTLFSKGWASALPPSAIDILEVLGDGRPPVLDEIDARLRRWTKRTEGLNSPAWLPTDTWFHRDEPHSDENTSAEDPATTGCGTDADRAAQFAHHLASKGLPVRFTMESVLRLLVACEVVTIGRWGDYSINSLAPTAADPFPG